MAFRNPYMSAEQTGQTCAPSSCQFLVIGAGSAGCVVARRLAEAGFNVVIVEEGVDPLAQTCDDQPNNNLLEKCADPLRCAELWGSGGWMAAKAGSDGDICYDDRIDYAFQTEPEEALGGRCVPLNAGRCLGGGSAINNGLFGVVWSEPHQNPWLDWYRTFGLKEWHPEYMQSCVDRAHKTIAPQLPSENGKLEAFDNAVAALRDSELLKDSDITSGPATRVAWCIDENGKRVSVASAYLGSTIVDGGAMKFNTGSVSVYTRSSVSKLVFEECDKDSDTIPQCKGAWIDIRGTKCVEQRRLFIQASCEVIVCCGTILTPLLLLQSGIGPREELAAAGIDVLINSPHVGKNLITQPTLPFKAHGSSAIPLVGPALQPVAPAKAPLGRGLEVAMFAWPQLGLLYALGMNTPAARGDVRLADDYPRNNDSKSPRIRLRLLSHPADLERMAWGVEKVRILAAHGALKDQYGGVEPELPPENCGMGAMFEWIRARVSSTRHPLGTCRMGHSVGDGVCDGSGRVLCASGACRGLRIADNSLVPSAPPDSHVMRVAVAIGERISEIILQDHRFVRDASSAL